MVTLPLLGVTKPRIVRISVVLPDPLAPISPQNSPGLSAKSMSSRMPRPESETLASTDRENLAPCQHDAQCPFCSVSVDTLSVTAFRRAAISASIHD